ncbi:threonine/homoserine/homoserine lactone efflux protein [Nocardia tenerifensis]|uniref:Threonine/homoserine/homoserine lactone efflux protein n=1 Tax=Nocardia tenerifensis TaxID=228006 RepID=A0A318K406_9NOCA|nr:LysE family translocator [Nocardia tenerifensis]PXX63224.1 threonine/homoserine/homoserine lactone efflux protein [Nocardia tenerifensis]
MSIEFLLTTLVICVTPGTGALFTLAAGLSRGAKAGVIAAFGCTVGTVPHLVAAMTGLAALLNASAVAFQTLKYLGVAYLIYMAWTTFRDKGALTVPEGPNEGAQSVRKVVTSAVLLNLLNPKLTIFAFAFLPQFVPAGSPNALARLLELSAVFMLTTFVVFAIYGVCAAAVRSQVISRPAVVTWMRRVFGVSFIALAGRLAVQNQ